MDKDLEATLRARRKLVDAALADALSDVQPDALRDAARWYPDAGGKRLRPVMALLACEAAGGRAEEALPVAVAVEMVHNFSLVHDDIMDRDDVRRGRPTVHRKWDEPTAILAGDLLLARAFEALAAMPDAAAHREASAVVAAAVRRLCEGQAMDVAFEGRADVTPEAYLEMIRGKTAVLFEASARGGALGARHRAAGSAEALGRFGEAFGLAFQMADDLLDVTADAQTLGKPWGSDVRAGKRTLLVLEALPRAGPDERAVLDRVLGRPGATDAEVAEVVRVFESTGALARVEEERDRWAEEADEMLSVLPESGARDALRKLNAWAARRSF